VFDLMFTFAHFEQHPLPSHLRDFQGMLHGAFPLIFDTKFLANLHPVLRRRYGFATGVEDLYTSIIAEQKKQAESDRLSIRLAAGFNRYESGDGYHEAGFDAFQTGFIFANFRNLIEESELNSIYANRSLLARSLFCFQYNPVSTEPYQLADANQAILHVHGFRDVQTADILHWFSPISINIRWINESSVLVLVDEKLREQAIDTFARTAKQYDHGATLLTMDDWIASKVILQQRAAEAAAAEKLAIAARKGRPDDAEIAKRRAEKVKKFSGENPVSIGASRSVWQDMSWGAVIGLGVGLLLGYLVRDRRR